MPVRPRSSIGDGCHGPTAPSPRPPTPDQGLEGAMAQSPGKCHHSLSPWDVRSRHVDDCRGPPTPAGALSPDMGPLQCSCGGVRATLPTHQEGPNESENYLNMGPTQPPSGCHHQSPCESGSSHCISPMKLDPPSVVGGDSASSLTSPNSNDYLDMGRGYPSGISSPPSGSLVSPRGCQDREGGCVSCTPCGHSGYCSVHHSGVNDTCGGGSHCSFCSTSSHHLPCCCGSHSCAASSSSGRSSSSRGLHQLTINSSNSGSLSRRSQQRIPTPTTLSSSQPDSSLDSGNYMDMTPTNPTQPKPIPGCYVEGDIYSPEDCASSSGGKQQQHQQSHCCVAHHNLDSARSSNLDALSTMDTDSVPDVEDSVDDILDGMHPETRRRLDSMDRPSADGSSDRGSGNGLDDMDLDMDMDTDQVDSGAGTTTNSITTSTSLIGGGSRGGSVSARACLETTVASTCGGGVGCSCSGGRPPPSMPLQHDEDELMSLERPFRTSSVGSKPDFTRRKNSAPMLGISCASRSWSDTSGSYFRNLFTPRSSQHGQREDLMYLDFTKNHKSSDHIAAHLLDDASKDKKSLSIEKIINTFKSRSSTKIKNKRGVSEGDSSSVSSRGGGGGSCGAPGGGGAIEIPSTHSDYFQMDFNPSPRSNTSTNSDVPLATYLAMRPGASLSFSSTCSNDYVDMDRGAVRSVCSNSSEATDGGYLLMSSPRTSMDMFFTPPTSSVLEGYVDMTQGPGGLSISADSSSSGSLSSRHRKTSNTYSHVSSIELPSPKEELPQFSYLHEIDPKGQQKDKKKSRKKSVKESGKRKKSDPGNGDTISDTIKSKGSSSLASFSSFLTRKNSQSSSTKTPLSPNGSPLPKSSRSSNSPFASLGRKSSSKDSRGKSNPPVSQSPSSGLATTPGGSLAPGFPSSPSNYSSGFPHGAPLTPRFGDPESSENENYYSLEADGLVNLPSHIGSFPRNHSSKELGSFDVNKHAANRSSGSFDLPSGSLLTVGGGGAEANVSSCGAGRCSGPSSSSSPCCNNHHNNGRHHVCHCGRTEAALCNAMSHHNYHQQHSQQQLHQHYLHSHSCELKDRGEPHVHDDAQNAYVNFDSGPDCGSLPTNASPFSAHRKTCCCSNISSSNNYPSAVCSNNSSRHCTCPRLASVDKVGQMEHSHNSVSGRPSSELGRLSESSLEDGRSSTACSPPQQTVAQDTASYVNMCPLNVRDKLLAVSNTSRSRDVCASPGVYCAASKSASNTPRTGTPCNERKILNTDQSNRGSLVLEYTSDYLEMDMRKACLNKTSNNAAYNSHIGSASSSSMASSSPCVPSAVTGPSLPRGVVKRPALPPLLLGARADPSVPLEKLSLTERGGGSTVESSGANPVTSSASTPPLNSSGRVEAVDCSLTTCSGSSNNNSSNSLVASNVCGQECRAARGGSGSCSAGSFSERCRSHSGPGAPEASRLEGNGTQDSIGLDVCEEVRRGEGEGKAQSVCSSPVSYSPPTSPSLASSSKSSLSEGGLSSASSTCTVVNVGLRLQQQQNRQSQGSGSSISNNTDTTANTAPQPLGSCATNSSTPGSTSDVSTISNTSGLIPSAAVAGLFTVNRASQIRQAVSQLPRAAQAPSQVNLNEGNTTSSTTKLGVSSTAVSQNKSSSPLSIESQPSVVYAYLDLAPPKRDIIHSGGSGSPASKRRLMPPSSASQGISEVAGGSVSSSSSTGGRTGDDAAGSGPSCTGDTSPSNYVEIDFKKSESLRNACIIRDALRH